MNIGEKIKEKRSSMNLTQQELAAQLNVSRSTVSNWEVGRNYPDIEMIVNISNLLDVSLDVLLKGDDQVVAKIANDTKIRKKQSRRILLLSLLITLIIISSLYIYLTFYSMQTITGEDQIKNITVTDKDSLIVKLNPPSYRTYSGYMVDSNSDNNSALNLSIFSDLTFKGVKKQTLKLDLTSDIFKNRKILFIKDSDHNTITEIKLD
ncbi:helix-turn-helix domain-containing protein [Brochothrix thermosphacta]|uniref:helix-turn-helix domain-containing protein n=1 Tax=Brochothrix thermosphacta TaxID=2756 RepID=UPI000D0EA1A8|nr:helix-turn-helix transcriptional regulator [Brochothrix thermosphacta]